MDPTSTSEKAPLLTNGLFREPSAVTDIESLIYNKKCAKADIWIHCHEEKKSVMDKKARRKLLFASGLCFLFMIGEVIGGYLANSLAIATDAAHMLTDFAGFMISIFSIYLASRKPSKTFNFGWYRAEVIGALVSVLLIWAVTGVLVYMAVLRVMNPNYDINATVMLITAAVGVLVNIILGLNLSDSESSTHSHSHNMSGNKKANKQLETSISLRGKKLSESSYKKDNKIVIEETEHDRNQNINVRAAFIHVLGDLVQSLGVVCASLIIYYKPEWKLADPICTFMFSVLVLITTFTILKDIIVVLMEGNVNSSEYDEVRTALENLSHVREVHSLRVWSLTMDKTAVSVHIALDKDGKIQTALAQAGKLLRDRFNVHESTIQTERYLDQMSTCDQCQQKCV